MDAFQFGERLDELHEECIDLIAEAFSSNKELGFSLWRLIRRSLRMIKFVKYFMESKPEIYTPILEKENKLIHEASNEILNIMKGMKDKIDT